MPSYLVFTTTRTTLPDPVALLANVRTAAVDATAGIGQFDATHFVVKKGTAFSASDIAAVQTAIDTTAALTPQVAAQNRIDAWAIEWRAMALTLLDQINVLRSGLPTPLPAVTPAQALAAIRAKAATLP